MSEEVSREDFVKEFFVRANRIDIWAAVLSYTVEPPERFTALELQTGLFMIHGIPKSNAFKEIQTLETWGMIKRLERSISEYPSVYYVRTESPIWDLAKVAISTTDQLFPPPKTKNSSRPIS